MSVFSDLLSEYITMKDVGVYPLSQFCGLDRSFMYKIINGKRNPSGEDVVRKMAQFMQLTPREKTDFMDFGAGVGRAGIFIYSGDGGGGRGGNLHGRYF